MSRRHSLRVAAVASVLAAVVLAGLHGVGPHAEPQGGAHADSPGPRLHRAAPPPAAVAPAAPVADASLAATAAGTFARVSAAHPEHDLRLLGRVRQITGGTVPDAIDRLLELRRREHADAETVGEFITREVPGLALKVAARRWLREDMLAHGEPVLARPPRSDPSTRGAPGVPTPVRRPMRAGEASER